MIQVGVERWSVATVTSSVVDGIDRSNYVSTRLFRPRSIDSVIHFGGGQRECVLLIILNSGHHPVQSPFLVPALLKNILECVITKIQLASHNRVDW